MQKYGVNYKNVSTSQQMWLYGSLFVLLDIFHFVCWLASENERKSIKFSRNFHEQIHKTCGSLEQQIISCLITSDKYTCKIQVYSAIYKCS